MRIVLVAAVVIGASPPLYAQTTLETTQDIFRVSQSADVVVQQSTISVQAASRIVSVAFEEARRRNMDVSVSVLDRSGTPVAFLRMDGAAQGSIETAVGKARTAVAWNMPSSDFEAMLRSGATGPLSLDGLVLIEGGVPLMFEGHPVGAIGVSGGSSQDDGAVARAAAAALDMPR